MLLSDLLPTVRGMRKLSVSGPVKAGSSVCRYPLAQGTLAFTVLSTVLWLRFKA